MSWITLSRDAITARLTGAELEALEDAFRNDGQTSAELIAELIAQVAREVRGYVRGCRSNTLSDGATEIPDELEAAALAILRHRLIARSPMGVSDARTKEYEDALELLQRVARCEFGIEAPATASSETTEGGPGSAAEQATATVTRQFTRTKMSGLFGK